MIVSQGSDHDQAAASPVFVERRLAVRVQERVRVLLREDRFATSGYTLNICRQGALIRSAAPLRPGTSYDFYLQGGPGKVRRTRVRVLRELPHYRYAVRFEDEITDFCP
jgi:hypothetical protein